MSARLFAVGDGLDASSVTAPSTRHRVNDSRHDLGFFDGQLAAHGVVMERTHGRRLNDVETGQVAAGGASVFIHTFTVMDAMTA